MLTTTETYAKRPNDAFGFSRIFLVLTGSEAILLQDKSSTVAFVNEACWGISFVSGVV